MDDLRTALERGKRFGPKQAVRIGDHADLRAGARLAITAFAHDHQDDLLLDDLLPESRPGEIDAITVESECTNASDASA
ncbi:hypothetical protein [Xanthomonas citri]|uniref:hypothetical protein n=1 Tax=Xanthomonas citri TaxID=346 RepID=UPI001F44CC7C|nr:hypothetical protein [Xanthomonas citri]UZB10402.1 hypothetical protein OM953_00725 [Xanthomonas citri pv. fuscans]